MPGAVGGAPVASGVVSAQVWFAEDEIVVRPGDQVSLSLAVENVGDRTESYTIIAAGLTAAWTTVTRPNITLFGGSRDVVEVLLRPPAIHTTTAGPTAVAVRVIPQTTPDESVVAEAVAVVQSFDDRRVTVLQPLQRARRRATFELIVENHGNNLASCRLHLVDPTDRIDGTFDPPAVGVAPGAANLVRLRLRARRAYLRRGERQLDFEVEATEPDHAPAVGRATLIQPPTIPARAIGRAFGVVVALAAIAAAWFAVVRPEIRDAATDAVDDRLAEQPASGDTVGGDATGDPATGAGDTTTTVPEEPPVPGEEPGEPAAWRLAAEVAINAQGSDSVDVPADQRFHLTDIVVQNPHGDLGTAQLLRNGELLYEWDLGAMTDANEFQPRITPLPFEPSDNIVLAVSCEASGEPTGTGCQISLLLTGRLVPAGDPAPA